MHCVKVFSLMVCIFVLDVASWSQKIAKEICVQPYRFQLSVKYLTPTAFTNVQCFP